ncbi:MAG: bifunctional UDP-N-acetylglucosamine diphosphorylase/glucosamine-1-phosphate N-acetyltransferase GlmU, partial [Gammaproteobacteria bacterium]|nr:bifunctional UDP-N-acetylglucosamine diphosphorylase/glucosamine-1-phosphate N-acetyltransferase GlmU [Gammaproteobacteria bacterium]
MNNLHVIVLAAGQGKRMLSESAKVMVPLAGKPLLHHVLDTIGELKPTKIYVVVGYAKDDVIDACADYDVQWVEQKEQLGTGHAVAQAMPHIPDNATVLIVYGDTPLIRSTTLTSLFPPLTETGGLAMLVGELDDPSGYGRVVRSADGQVQRIIEHKDASEDVRRIKEINTGIYASLARNLKSWIGMIGNQNAQGEQYLTDIVEMAVAESHPVHDQPCRESETHGVNTPAELARCESTLRQRQTNTLMNQGVRICDPARIDIRGELHCGKNVYIDVNCVFEGNVRLGDNTVVGPNNVLSNCDIGAGTHIKPSCVLEDAAIGDDCEIGPFCRIRPLTTIEDQVRLGSFVEVKRSTIGPSSTAKHFSYIGDTDMGASVNIGAGTVTCDYDGHEKHRTIIESGAFIGSGAMLIAPVRVGTRAFIGAGSVITKDAPGEKLTLSRSEQQTV